MPQYRYNLTELGREVMLRGELPITEDVVLGVVWEKGSFRRRGVTIPEIQDTLVEQAKSLDLGAQALGTGAAGNVRYAASKTFEASDPLRVRQMLQLLVSRGLLERLG